MKTQVLEMEYSFGVLSCLMLHNSQGRDKIDLSTLDPSPHCHVGLHWVCYCRYTDKKVLTLCLFASQKAKRANCRCRGIA